MKYQLPTHACVYIYIYIITLNGRRKKIKKSRKQKNITEKSNTEKKPIKILKNLTGLVWVSVSVL